jgi:hypothetical protein
MLSRNRNPRFFQLSRFCKIILISILIASRFRKIKLFMITNTAPNLYALLVAIDTYPRESMVRNLNGCVADVQAMDRMLDQHAPGNYNYHRTILCNQEATYHALHSAFKLQLHQATPEDIVFFMFAGHGSRQPSAEDFAGFGAEDETLVCYDSRLLGGLDLADKELAVLLSGIQANHLLVILDCCHGGSGTRNSSLPSHLNIRMAPLHYFARPLESYSHGYYSAQKMARGSVAVPLRPHLLLAACGPHQFAAETPSGRGAFSAALQQVLGGEGFHQAYQLLFEQTRASLLEKGYTQTPQFECYGGEDPQRSFLGLGQASSSLQPFRLYEGMPDRWFIDFGAIHGLPEGSAAELYVDLFAADGASETFKLIGLGPERIEIALPETNAFTSGASVSASLRFIALNDTYIDLQCAAFNLQDLQGLVPPWMHFAPHTYPATSGFRLIQLASGRMELIDLESTQLLRWIAEPSGQCLLLLMDSLVKVIRWRHLLRLSNGCMEPYFDQVFVHFDLIDRGGQAIQLPDNWREVTLDHGADGIPSHFPHIRISNHSGHRVHVYLFHASQKYGIELLEAREYGDLTQAGTLWGQATDRGLFLPKGQDHAIDRFIVLLSTQPIEAWKLTQSGFEPGSEIQSKRDLVSRCDSHPTRWVCRKWELTLAKKHTLPT